MKMALVYEDYLAKHGAAGPTPGSETWRGCLGPRRTSLETGLGKVQAQQAEAVADAAERAVSER